MMKGTGHSIYWKKPNGSMVLVGLIDYIHGTFRVQNKRTKLWSTHYFINEVGELVITAKEHYEKD